VLLGIAKLLPEEKSTPRGIAAGRLLDNATIASLVVRVAFLDGTGRWRRYLVRNGDVTETLNGFIERVTYHNSQNGFAVLRVKREDLVWWSRFLQPHSIAICTNIGVAFATIATFATYLESAEGQGFSSACRAPGSKQNARAPFLFVLTQTKLELSTAECCLDRLARRDLIEPIRAALIKTASCPAHSE